MKITGRARPHFGGLLGPLAPTRKKFITTIKFLSFFFCFLYNHSKKDTVVDVI
jgi:hypothetical protein